MLLENTSKILKRISHAAMRSGRNPEDVKLIAVTKTVDPATIKEAINIGLRIFGENRVQEARKKIEELRPEFANSKIEWHLIGTLQRNKAKYAVHLFDLIHTIDSIELAEEVNKQAEKINKQQRVLIQVKLSSEITKHGILEEQLFALIERIKKLENLKLEGLMTMPPLFDDKEKTRPFFRRLRELREEAQKRGVILQELSMGMSNDFEVAIEEGSTMVRIGTALFGERAL
ncbi:MAG: YggS family pyridoxal phosphate-dependent enzyme [Thermodesulfovibrionales bacterium]|nr:YggS family pyridoxal phosphate-dependent enzyme [Thermodesulfovibrionales bacterium]